MYVTRHVRSPAPALPAPGATAVTVVQLDVRAQLKVLDIVLVVPQERSVAHVNGQLVGRGVVGVCLRARGQRLLWVPS